LQLFEFISIYFNNIICRYFNSCCYCFAYSFVREKCKQNVEGVGGGQPCVYRYNVLIYRLFISWRLHL